MSEQIVIVGGGLSGLLLAYRLSKKNIQATVLEASTRLGGRIQTVKGTLDTPLELGATWFSSVHPNMLALIDELGLKKHPQFSKGISLYQTSSTEPPQQFFSEDEDDPSYRIVGGTQMLIEKLREKLSPENIQLNTKVTAIKDMENELLIETSDGRQISASKVVLCMPPQLAGSQIQFSPQLPNEVSKILPNVHTWMSGSIKFVLEYSEPFWRKKGYSGMLFGRSGIVIEMYDHNNFEGNKFGFTGFLNGAASSFPQETRKELVLKQLAECFGKESLSPSYYADKVWTDEFVLSGNPIQRVHQYNGHSLLQQPYMNGRLYFSGTETSTENAGYMEGAIISALKMAKNLLNSK